MRNVHVTLIALLVLAALALPACSSSAPATTQPGLIAAPASPIADVPIPAGFSLQTGKDSWFQVIPQSNQRFVHHTYRGWDNYLAVTRFYKEQMPKYGWTSVSEQQVGDTMTLAFSKNNEPATITIVEGTFHTYIYVEINLGVRPGGHS